MTGRAGGGAGRSGRRALGGGGAATSVRARGRPDPEGGARPRFGVDADRSPVGVGDGRDDGQAQAHARRWSGPATGRRGGRARRCGRGRRGRCPDRGRPRSAAPSSPTALTTTSIGVPPGVWLMALARRLSTTWRRRLASPTTTTGAGGAKVTRRSGAFTRAASTAAAATAVSSTCSWASGRSRSRRASRSRSSTSSLMRLASERMWRMEVARSSGRSRAPRSKISA